MEPTNTAWLPTLEANQGTLSLVALVFAVGWGLWEQHRANIAEQLRERRAITDAADIIKRTSNLLEFQNERQIPFSDLCERLRLTGDALRGFAVVNGSMPALAVSVLRAAAQFHLAASAVSSSNLTQLSPDVVMEIASVRAEIDIVLVRWDEAHRGFMDRLRLVLARHGKRRRPRVITANHPGYPPGAR